MSSHCVVTFSLTQIYLFIFFKSPFAMEFFLLLLHKLLFDMPLVSMLLVSVGLSLFSLFRHTNLSVQRPLSQSSAADVGLT